MTHRQPRISHEAQTWTAVLHEQGYPADLIAFLMGLPVDAVQAIIAAFEWRAERYFRITSTVDARRR
jgi:hypothetical protein